MGKSRVSLKRLAVSNAGPLVHLAQAGLLELFKLYDTVIRVEVKQEVVDRGKEKGFSDALLVEQAVERGSLRVVTVHTDARFMKAAGVAGLQQAEVGVVYHAYRNSGTALLDEEAARMFARGLGVKVRGSIGVLIEGVKAGLVTPSEGVQGLDRLAEVMYLSASVYRLALKRLQECK